MRSKAKPLTRIRVRGKRRRWLETIIILIIALVIWGFLREWKYRQSDDWQDVHPSQKQLDTWSIKNFDPTGYKIWNTNPKLQGSEFHNKIIFNQETYLTPFGENNWGVGCYSWKYLENEDAVKSYPARICLLHNGQKDNGVYIFVDHHNYKQYNRDYDKYGHYGIGALLQGWTHSGHPPFNHHIPQPLKTANKKIVLSFDMNITTASYDGKMSDAWQFIGATLWFKSPNLSKHVVMDLMIYTNGKTLHTENTEKVYRYQRVLSKNKKETFNRWQHYNVDLTWFINDMLQRFEIEHASDTLKLYSLEILCETAFGKCGFWVKKIYLYYK